MRVRAIQMGFYGGARRREGAEFTLTNPKHFSKKWMEVIEGAKAPKEAPAETNPMPSKAALALCKEHNLDFENIEGTGANGQVTVSDVKIHLEQLSAAKGGEGDEGGEGDGSDLL